MRIFLSHSSRQKSLIREIQESLPNHLDTWLDEDQLIFGDDIASSLEHTIKADTDYVLLFIDNGAAASSWVRREVEWAMEAERKAGRTILLPIAVESSAVRLMDNAALERRKYLVLHDHSKVSVRSLADSITAELFALVCRDVHRAKDRGPAGLLTRIAGADELLKAQAELIQKAVFPHRRRNPISRETLRRVVNSQAETAIDHDDFETLLSTTIQRGLVPGLHFDGEDLFIVEEHAAWKSNLQRQHKEQIAKHLAASVKNGSTLFLDAGSTTGRLAQLICRRIEIRAITHMVIATTSINIADMISDTCVKMGFDDDFSAVRLFIPGGRVRPGTQAIIPAGSDQASQIARIADAVGGFELAIVGVNGVDADQGFSTHEQSEALNKRDIIAVSRRTLIAGDSSKVGIALECAFATFDDDVTYVVNRDPSNDSLTALASQYPQKIDYA